MELTQLSIVDSVNLVSCRQVSVSEIVDAHVSRSLALQDELNAYTFIDGEGAGMRARLLDERLASGKRIGRLAGVCVGVKDLIDQANLPTTCGSSFLRQKARASATVVRRLEMAGAVVVGRQNLSEFAFADFATENHWWGPARNPWDLETSPGGSSGGSAAAVAAGLSGLAIATDTGGSVRVPAALCGVVGLKVTHGRVSLNGVFPLTPSLDSVGPLTRSVGDAKLAYWAMAGYDESDPWSSPRAVTFPEGPTSLSELRIGIPHPWVDYPVAKGLRKSFFAALEDMESAGAKVEELEIPGLDPGQGIGLPARWAEVADVHRKWFSEDPERYSPALAKKLAPLMDLDLGDYLQVLRWRTGVRHTAERIFDDVDLLAIPSIAAMHKRVGVDTVDIDGVSVGHEDAFATFAFLVNLMGSAALSIPIVGKPTTLPASLQLVGPAWSEGMLLGVGEALEKEGIAGFRPPPIW